MRRAIKLTMMTAALSGLAAHSGGCAPHSDSPPPAGVGWSNGSRMKNAASPGWPFWPTRVRLHPSTRIIKDAPSSQWLIETRIEFADSDGASSKAVGQLTIQLWDGSAASATEPLQTFNMDLRDPAVNRRQYDDVMRTYLFRLEVDAAKLPENPEIRVYFVSVDGQNLNATMHLRR